MKKIFLLSVLPKCRPWMCKGGWECLLRVSGGRYAYEGKCLWMWGMEHTNWDFVGGVFLYKSFEHVSGSCYHDAIPTMI